MDAVEAAARLLEENSCFNAGRGSVLTEDGVVGQGATPAPSVTTGASTIWEMATVVFKS